MTPMAKQAQAPVVITDAMAKYIDMVKLSRSEHTARAYKNALQTFDIPDAQSENFSREKFSRGRRRDRMREGQGGALSG